MVLGPVGRNELVHDAAIGLHKLVLRPLAKPRQHRPRIAHPDQPRNRQRRGHLHRGRTRQPRPQGYVAPKAQAETRNRMALPGQNRNHTQRVVRPALAGLRRQGRCLKTPLFAVVLRIENDLAVRARRNAGQRGKIDRHRHHKPLGIVGMLTDQVHAARRRKDRRLRMEAGNVHRTKNIGIMHISSHSHWIQFQPPLARKRFPRRPAPATTAPFSPASQRAP